MITVNTNNAPAAIGPYSQGIVCQDLLFTSGQIPLSPKTGEIVGTDISAQAVQALTNLKSVVEAAGSSMDKLVKTTCFLADMNDFATFNTIYADFISSNPARSCVAVKQLPKNVLVEVEAIASLK
ncbi:MAG: RidA family protein [Oscillospiraceae bacterium]